MTSKAGDTSFICPVLWPSNSPDLELICYKTWGVIQQRVYQLQVHNIDELKQRLLSVWQALRTASLRMHLTNGEIIFDHTYVQIVDT